ARGRSGSGQECRRSRLALRAVDLDPAVVATELFEQQAHLVAVAGGGEAMDRDHAAAPARRASHSARVWPQTSTGFASNGGGSRPGPRLREPRRRASACEGALPGSMQWITSSQPRLANAQSMAATAASVA